jgi:NAD(P)-dependent dehydrogenase (short-subunit alcohol dehydrogenase family)
MGRLQETQSLVEAAGRRAVAIQTDVTKPEDCEALAAAGIEAFGRIDILVNNAGVGGAVPATRETPDQFRHVIDVNLHGSYWMAQVCARVMQPGSSIVNISSIAALTTIGLPLASYTSSKTAIIGLTRDLAQQWTPRKGIRVNAIAPGFFASEMTEAFTPEYALQQARRVPIGRFGEAEELAATLIFLASSASAYVTGQTLAVDGGFIIT